MKIALASDHGGFTLKEQVKEHLLKRDIEVIDLGTDVEPDAFIAKAEEIGADVIGMSALLTTTMPNMKGVVELLEEKGLREKYIVMIGGAPVNESFAEEVGADYYTPDAATAAEVAKKAVTERA